MTNIYITKRGGEVMRVDEYDRITRRTLDGVTVQPSDDWTMLGAVEYGRGYLAGRIIRRYSMTDVRECRVPWFFKNGKQRCFVLDNDHGTTRVQMSPPTVKVCTWVA